MSYKEIDEEGFEDDLLERKEFYQFKSDPDFNFKHPMPDPLGSTMYKLTSYQHFAKNYISPNTPYQRILLNHACHGEGTRVLMGNGTYQTIETIKIGDVIQGEQDLATVTSIHTGFQQMYRVHIGRLSFTCNEHHLLTCVPRTEVPLFEEDDVYKMNTPINKVDIPTYLVDSSKFLMIYKFNLLTNFTIEHIGYGRYYGFGLAGKLQRYYIVDGILTHNTGTGKCLDGKTQVMIYGGSIKAAADIRIGDVLIGDDGGPRMVLACCFGRAKMYQIILDTGEWFICNSEHIITIQHTSGMIADVPLDVYLSDDFVRDGWGMMKYRPGLARIRKKLEKYSSLTIDVNVIHLYGLNLCDFIDANIHINHGVIDVKSIFADAIPFIATPIGDGNYYGFTVDGNGRFVLGSGIITHNTMSALSIATEFIRSYKAIYNSLLEKTNELKYELQELDRTTPSVFYLGFHGSRTAAMRDLTKNPEFDIVTYGEAQELTKRRMMAATGTQSDNEYLREMGVKIKRRILDKKLGGFYKFYGYQEFVNRLFDMDAVTLVDINTEFMNRVKNGEQVTLEDMIYDAIRENKLRVNQKLLMQLKNSLIIADEVHNTYNSKSKNNYGVAIQYVLDTVPGVRLVMTTATPFNNSPMEVIDVLNYLMPPSKKLNKADFFENEHTLKPGKLEEIGRLSRGYVSFLQDVNPIYYPSYTFIGETIRVPKAYGTLSAGDEIPYLKFIACPMSELHQRTVEKVLIEGVGSSDDRDAADEDADTHEDDGDISVAKHRANTYDYHGIPTDGLTLFDGVFPNPADGEVDPSNMKVGLFRSKNVLNMIASAPPDWQTKVGIAIKKQGNIRYTMGSWLLADNIKYYFSKLHRLYNELRSVPPNEKIALWHYNVRMNGVVLIQEFLKINGYIDEFSSPTDSTICAVCNKPQSEHKNDAPHVTFNDDNIDDAPNKPHQFMPSRFIMMHADIDKAQIVSSYTKYNSYDNRYGHKFRIMVGSKLIRESYDFKCIRHMMFLSMATNISMLIQLFGRPVRKGSHADLPPGKRTVKFYIFVTTVNQAYPASDNVSPELYKYVDKLDDYKVIQLISREININAIDADIHRDIIMPKQLQNQYFPDGASKPKAIIGNLYFDHVVRAPKIEVANEITYNAYGHYMGEIKTITYLIKRLFIMQPVWKYTDLWAYVQRPPFGIEMNPKLFTEGNFRIALNHLIGGVDYMQALQQHEVERLLNYDDCYIYRSGTPYRISQMGEFYILFPAINANPRAGEKLTQFKDVETYIRPPRSSMSINVSIKTFVNNEIAQLNFEHQKLRLKTILTSKNPQEILVSFNSVFQRKLIEEIIVGKVKNELGEKALQESFADNVLSIYYTFGIIIKARELKKYKSVVDQFDKRVMNIADGTPIGYLAQESVRLYNFAENKWLDVSRLAMNKQSMFEENDIVVGILEDSNDEVRFKVRQPIDKLRSMIKQKKDMRLIDRGMVCSTKNKDYLLKLMSGLGIKPPREDIQSIGIKSLCGNILTKLLSREQYERQKMGKYKWVYFWWDEVVNI